MYELVNTSVPHGLIAGAHGFATVAMTKGMPDAIRQRVESLCAYPHRTSAHDASYYSENPVNWFSLTVAGGSRVVGRTAPAEFDYTGRTNRLSRLFCFAVREMPRAGGAAVLKAARDWFCEDWRGEPRYLSEDRALGSRLCAIARSRADDSSHWRTLFGASGVTYARRFAALLRQNLGTGKSIFFKAAKADVDGTRLLGLFADLIDLLPEDLAAQVTFSTFAACVPSGCVCHLRGIYDRDRAFEVSSTLQPWVDCESGTVQHAELLPQEDAGSVPSGREERQMDALASGATGRDGHANGGRISPTRTRPRFVSERTIRRSDRLVGTSRSSCLLPVCIGLVGITVIGLLAGACYWYVKMPHSKNDFLDPLASQPSDREKSSDDWYVGQTNTLAAVKTEFEKAEKTTTGLRLILTKVKSQIKNLELSREDDDFSSRKEWLEDVRKKWETLESEVEGELNKVKKREEDRSRVKMKERIAGAKDALEQRFEKTKKRLEDLRKKIEGAKDSLALEKIKEEIEQAGNSSKLELEEEVRNDQDLQRLAERHKKKVEEIRKGLHKSLDEKLSEVRQKEKSLDKLSITKILSNSNSEKKKNWFDVAGLSESEKNNLTNSESIIYFYYSSGKCQRATGCLEREEDKDPFTKRITPSWKEKSASKPRFGDSPWRVIYIPASTNVYWQWQLPIEKKLFEKTNSVNLVELVFGGTNDAFRLYARSCPLKSVVYVVSWEWNTWWGTGPNLSIDQLKPDTKSMRQCEKRIKDLNDVIERREKEKADCDTDISDADEKCREMKLKLVEYEKIKKQKAESDKEKEKKKGDLEKLKFSAYDLFSKFAGWPTGVLQKDKRVDFSKIKEKDITDAKERYIKEKRDTRKFLEKDIEKKKEEKQQMESRKNWTTKASELAYSVYVLSDSELPAEIEKRLADDERERWENEGKLDKVVSPTGVGGH